jgi:hypothetical protein
VVDEADVVVHWSGRDGQTVESRVVCCGGCVVLVVSLLVGLWDGVVYL